MRSRLVNRRFTRKRRTACAGVFGYSVPVQVTTCIKILTKLCEQNEMLQKFMRFLQIMAL